VTSAGAHHRFVRAGGDGAAAAGWASEVKLESWVRVLPMLRALEIQGVDVSRADAALVPLAERFDLEIADTPENEESFVLEQMVPRGEGGLWAHVNAMTVLFGLALAMPVLLLVFLAVRTLLVKDAVPEEAAGADEL
jgi:hypothetical protein